jgi:hypothetical protein
MAPLDPNPTATTPNKVVEFVRDHTFELIWTGLIAVGAAFLSFAALKANDAVDRYVRLRASSEFSTRLRSVGPASNLFNDNSWKASCDSTERALGGFCQVNEIKDNRKPNYRLTNGGLHPPNVFNEYVCTYASDTPVKAQDISVWAQCYRVKD